MAGRFTEINYQGKQLITNFRIIGYVLFDNCRLAPAAEKKNRKEREK